MTLGLSMFVRRFLHALIVLALLGTFGTGRASASTPGEFTTYPVKPCSNLLAAPEGVLVRRCDEPGASSEPAVVNILSGGGVTSRAVPAENSSFIATGPAGDLWLGLVAEGSYGKEEAGAVDRVAADGAVQTFPVPKAPRYQEVFFHGLVVDGGGTAWGAIGYEMNEGFPVGSTVGGELLRFTPDGRTKSFTLPHHLYPEGLVVGPEGNVWFTAVTGRRVGEHSYEAGTGFVGRLDPSGRFALFRTPVRGGVPGAIAIGPDGKLWFTESGTPAIDTITPDGTFGRRFPFRLGGPGGSLAVGPEGDLWSNVSGGIARMTPRGQQTLFPGNLSYGEMSGVVTGDAGDIWSLGKEDVERLVPGAPGIDIRRLTGRMSSGTIGVLLACGGSASACEGTLDVELETPSIYRQRHRGSVNARAYRLAEMPYSVPAESQALVRVPVSAKALSLIALFRHFQVREGVRLEARATVVGGPPLRRELRATLGTRPETR
jgi:virginiamycin B lyase